MGLFNRLLTQPIVKALKPKNMTSALSKTIEKVKATPGATFRAGKGVIGSGLGFTFGGVTVGPKIISQFGKALATRSLRRPLKIDKSLFDPNLKSLDPQVPLLKDIKRFDPDLTLAVSRRPDKGIAKKAVELGSRGVTSFIPKVRVSGIPKSDNPAINKARGLRRRIGLLIADQTQPILANEQGIILGRSIESWKETFRSKFYMLKAQTDKLIDEELSKVPVSQMRKKFINGRAELKNNELMAEVQNPGTSKSPNIQLAARLTKVFTDELADAQQAEKMLGERLKNWLPHRYDREKILNDRKAFKTWAAKNFLRFDRPEPKNAIEAQQFAEDAKKFSEDFYTGEMYLKGSHKIGLELSSSHHRPITWPFKVKKEYLITNFDELLFDAAEKVGTRIGARKVFGQGTISPRFSRTEIDKITGKPAIEKDLITGEDLTVEANPVFEAIKKVDTAYQKAFDKMESGSAKDLLKSEQLEAVSDLNKMATQAFTGRGFEPDIGFKEPHRVSLFASETATRFLMMVMTPKAAFNSITELTRTVVSSVHSAPQFIALIEEVFRDRKLFVKDNDLMQQLGLQFEEQSSMMVSMLEGFLNQGSTANKFGQDFWGKKMSTVSKVTAAGVKAFAAASWQTQNRSMTRISAAIMRPVELMQDIDLLVRGKLPKVTETYLASININRENGPAILNQYHGNAKTTSLFSSQRGLTDFNLPAWRDPKTGDPEAADLFLDAVRREVEKSDLTGTKIGQAPWFAQNPSGRFLLALGRWRFAQQDFFGRNLINGRNGTAITTITFLGTALYLETMKNFANKIQRERSVEDAISGFDIPTEIEVAANNLSLIGPTQSLLDAMNRSKFLAENTLTIPAIISRLRDRSIDETPGQRKFESGRVVEALAGPGVSKISELNRVANADPNFRGAIRMLPFAQLAELWAQALGLTEMSDFIFGDPRRSNTKLPGMRSLRSSSLKQALR